MTPRWTPVVEELLERFSADSDIMEVETYLTSQGYDRGEIGEILSLLYKDAVPATVWDGSDTRRTAPLRVQGPHERGRFSTDAWGYLLMLGMTGAIAPNDFEHLVERALIHVDGRIGLPEIRAIAEDAGLDEPTASGERSQVH